MENKMEISQERLKRLRKMSGNRKGKKNSEEHNRKISIAKKGKNFSEKHKKAISKGLKGRKFSEKHRKNIGLGLIGKKNTLGKHWKVKNTSKMGKVWKGKKRPPMSEETKRKIRQFGGRKKIADRSLLKTDRQKAYDTKYKYWMLKVKKRDNWRCKINNKDCKGRLEAHHILSWQDFPELRYNINNGISLCQAHHPRVRAEEKRLISIFQGLVSVSKE